MMRASTYAGMSATVRGRVICAFAISSLLALSGAAFAEAATRRYSVSYSGSGHMTSNTVIDLAPQCGDVTITRDENTHFTWIDQWHLTLAVGSRVRSGSATDKALPITGHNNNSTITLDGSGAGCQGGSATCKGDSEPEPGWDADLKVQGGDGSTRLKAEALGGAKGWTPKDFSGTWADPNSILGADSCDEYATDFNELLVPLVEVPDEFKASFPVRVATWKSLRRGHYFKVKISEGHYAPTLPVYDECQADDGCNSLDFSFNGTVKVTRLS
jgi:hypothetical protein